jgi:hypothetical protein
MAERITVTWNEQTPAHTQTSLPEKTARRSGQPAAFRGAPSENIGFVQPQKLTEMAATKRNMPVLATGHGPFSN